MSGSVTACALGWGKAPWTSPHLPVGLQREDNCGGSLGANPVSFLALLSPSRVFLVFMKASHLGGWMKGLEEG